MTLLLCWSNDSDVRANSFHDFISKQDHRDWFSQGLTNPNRLHFIALTSMQFSWTDTVR